MNKALGFFPGAHAAFEHFVFERGQQFAFAAHVAELTRLAGLAG